MRRKFTEEHKRKISMSMVGNKNGKGHTAWNKGISWITAQHKKKMISASLGEKNHMWKGDKVGYDALHDWVVRQKGKPEKCEYCKKTGLVGQKIHWANKSRKYKRNLKDWIRLCAKCHKLYDKAWLKRKRNKYGQFKESIL